jgi:hypothetical protein
MPLGKGSRVPTLDVARSRFERRRQTRWENHADYVKAFDLLLRDLRSAPDDRATVKPAP